jgi:hypothetical protein
MTSEQLGELNRKKKAGDALGLTSSQQLEYLNP